MKAEPAEPHPDQRSGGLLGVPVATVGPSDPVSELGPTVVGVEMMESDPPDQRVVGTPDDLQVEGPPLAESGPGPVEVLLGVGGRVRLRDVQGPAGDRRVVEEGDERPSPIGSWSP
jgi:hypothetical protein